MYFQGEDSLRQWMPSKCKSTLVHTINKHSNLENEGCQSQLRMHPSKVQIQLSFDKHKRLVTSYKTQMYKFIYKKY